MDFPLIDETQLPPHLYLSGGWKKRRPDGTLGPTENFSSSMLDKFECLRAGAWSYIMGVKEVFKNEEADRGTVLHGMMEDLYDGKPLPLEDPDAMRRWIAWRALPALPFIPLPDQAGLEYLYAESSDWLDSTAILPDVEPLRVLVKKDLTYGLNGQSVVLDYKSVKNWDRMKTEQELRDDTQGILYPIQEMLKWGRSTVRGTWLYINMDPDEDPAARPIHVDFTWERSVLPAQKVLRKADEIRKLIRLRVHPNDLPPAPHCCLKYYSSKKDTGGCPYRPEVGGPCNYTDPKRQSFDKRGNYMLGSGGMFSGASQLVGLAPVLQNLELPAIKEFTNMQNNQVPQFPPNNFPPPTPPSQPTPPAHFPAPPPGWTYVLNQQTGQWEYAQASAPPPPPVTQTPFTPPETTQAAQAAPVQQVQTTIVPPSGPGSGQGVASPTLPGAPPTSPVEPPKEKKKSGRKSNAEKEAEKAAKAAEEAAAKAAAEQVEVESGEEPAERDHASAKDNVEKVTVLVTMKNGVSISYEVEPGGIRDTMVGWAVDAVKEIV